MAEWVWVLAALGIYFQNVNAKIALSQAPSISTSPGNTVKITCTLSGGNIGSSYPSWYWQKPGSAPVFVWYGTSTRGPGIPDRFTGSMESSSNQMHLTITNVEPEDAADYYCGVGAGNVFTFGKGTKLNLGSPQSPSVSVLPPSADQVRVKGIATLVCLVSRFNPGAVNIEWTVDGSARKDGVETSRVQQDTDNTFSASSYLSLPASVWNSHERYSCVVKHEAQATPIKANIDRSSCI